MTSVTGMVAAGAILPVEALIKSPPARIPIFAREPNVVVGLELACFENDFQVCGTADSFCCGNFVA